MLRPPDRATPTQRWPRRSVVEILRYPSEVRALADELGESVGCGWYELRLSCGHIVARTGHRQTARCGVCATVN